MSHAFARRAALAGLGTLFAWSFAPRLVGAQGRDPRLLVIVLRGALDGLAVVQPVGDPAFADLRGAESGTPHPLDGMFALHGDMPRLLAMFQAGEALAVHAVHTPYRSRSHFDGQDVLETGLGGVPGNTRTGWLNRALLALPRGARLPAPKGLAVEPTVPVIMQGRAPVETWQPQAFRYVDHELTARLLDLYESRDHRLAEALRQGAALDDLMQAEAQGRAAGPRVPRFVAEAQAAASIMARPDGPRVAALSVTGWDTHSVQGTAQGALARRLAMLDQALGALRDGLAPVWRDTAVAVVTEFGRTVAINGSRGTDHGMGSVALVMGGRVAGGRVLADWPGLAPGQLFEGRDLRPTTDLRAVLAGLLAEQLHLSEAGLREAFPDASGLRPVRGLLRSG